MSTLYLQLLVLTVTIEMAVAALLAPARERRRTVATALCANLMSHPLAALLLLRSPAPFALVEILVVVGEGFAYRRVAGLPLGRAAAIAVVANGATTVLAILMS